MSDVYVLYKSCVAQRAKLTTLFAEFKCFDDSSVCKQLNGKMMNHVSSSLSAWEKRFYWWSWNKLFDQYQNVLSSCKKRINQMPFIV